MSTLFLIRVLVFAAILRFAGRRWRVPYLEAAICILVGSLLLQFARTTSSFHGWHIYGFVTLGLVMIGVGTSNLWRQRTSRIWL